MQVMTHSLEEFEAEARRFAAGLTHRVTGATVVTLSGELGAGKTTFTQVIARELGVTENITSPTFVIEKIYQLPMMDITGPSFDRLIHIDAYRLKDNRELEVLGWKEIVVDPKNLILLEWPEHIPDLIPPTATRVTLEGAHNDRIITYGESK